MNKLSKDLFISTIFSFLNVLFNFWLIKEAEYTFSVVHLGVFMYIRRIAPTFSNFSQLGTSQALIRFTSIEKGDEQKIKIYYTISILIWILMSVFLASIFCFFHSFLGNYFFQNNTNPIACLRVTFIYISILHLSYIILPYFLNLRKILIYNIIQLLAASLIMLLVFKFINSNNNFIIILNNALLYIFIILITSLLYIIIKIKIYVFPSLKEIKVVGKKFMNYGLPRAIITFSDMFLLTVGAMMIQGEDEIIGGFLIGITLSRTILLILQPISLISAVISGHKNSEEHHKTVVNLLVGGTLYVAIIATVLLYNWIDILLPYWLENKETINIVVYIYKLLAFGLVPYALFQALKGVIEIKFFKPLNLYSLLIGVISHVVIYGLLNMFMSTIIALSVSLMISYVLLGFFSLFWNREYLKTYKYFNIIPLLLLNGILFLINFILHSYIPTIIGFLISCSISGVLFLIFIIKIESTFIQEIVSVIKKK